MSVGSDPLVGRLGLPDVCGPQDLGGGADAPGSQHCRAIWVAAEFRRFLEVYRERDRGARRGR